MKWEYMSKKIAVTDGVDPRLIDNRVKIELDGPGLEEWELVSVVDEQGAYVRAFYKRVLPE